MAWDKMSGDSVTYRFKTYCMSDDILWKITLDDSQSGSKDDEDCGITDEGCK